MSKSLMAEKTNTGDAGVFLLQWSGSETLVPTVPTAETDAVADRQRLVLHLSAAWGRWLDVSNVKAMPGVDPLAADWDLQAWGFLCPVVFRFEQAQWTGDALSDCVGTVAEGGLWLDGEPADPLHSTGLTQRLRLPLQHQGAVSGEWRWASGACLRVQARAVQASWADAAGPGARFQLPLFC